MEGQLADSTGTLPDSTYLAATEIKANPTPLQIRTKQIADEALAKRSEQQDTLPLSLLGDKENRSVPVAEANMALPFSQESLKEYRQLIEGYEKIYAKAATRTPAVQALAQEFCRRNLAIFDAYVNCQRADRHDSRELAGPVSRREPPLYPQLLESEEFQQILARIRHLGLDEKSSGSVGSNPLSMELVLQSGTLRERMSLSLAFMLFLERTQLLHDENFLLRINEKLRDLKDGAPFQIDIEFIRSRRGKLGEKKLFTFCEIALSRYRSDSNGSAYRKPFHPDALAARQKRTIQDLEEPTIRELRTLTQEPITPKIFESFQQGQRPDLNKRLVTWQAGGDLTYLSPNYDFVQRAVAMGGLPVLCGPSGTSNTFFNMACMVGLQNDLALFQAALVAWMVPQRDHTLHEIRIIGDVFGLPYQGTPENFGPDDPSTAPEVKRQLEILLEENQLPYPSSVLKE